MAANILHYGQELSECFPFLRKAGYSISRYEKIFEFREVLQSGTSHDAISLCEVEDAESRLVVQAARTYSPAPLILFHTANVIPFSAGGQELAGMQEDPGSEFDLVIRASASPWIWISEIDELIARSRELFNESRRIREVSAVLRQEAEAAREKTRFERERAEAERARNALTVAAPAIPADRMLRCSVCGEEFVFSAGEQLFFQLRNFINDPKQCRRCRSRRQKRAVPARPETTVTCAECGASTTVPFRPFQGRPVLCRTCFEKKRNGG
jgi:CxxC-x17-CxxC domain-containing protein